MKIKKIAFAAMIAGMIGVAQADTIQKINQSGSITMGVRDASGALSYALGNGGFAGYHVELCSRVIQELEKKLGKKIEIKYQVVNARNRIPLVQNGTVDIECGSTTNNEARQNDVSFAVTTFVDEVRMAVKKSSGIKSISDLNGKNVAVTAGTTAVDTLKNHDKARGIAFKEVYGKDHADSFDALATGKADAFVMDASILAGNIAKAKNPNEFELVGEVLNVEPIAIMLKKDDKEFKSFVDGVLTGIMKSGEIEKIYDKWFVNPIPPDNARVGLPASNTTKAAWSAPNDKPKERYTK